MRERTVFKKGGSLYVNFPREVVSMSGIKEGQRVDVGFVWGVGIVVSRPHEAGPPTRMFDTFDASKLRKKKK